jgi:hypothetical protein
LDGPLAKWCPAVALSRQDGHHSAVALLLKAALIQVSDYRLLGASGFTITFHTENMHWLTEHFRKLIYMNKGNMRYSTC